MREQYYHFILDHHLSDTLIEVPEISFSLKISILDELLSLYSKQVINIALYNYKQNYIDLNRVKIVLLRNTLKNLCERIQNGANKS
jgi:hypothetical protein